MKPYSLIGQLKSKLALGAVWYEHPKSPLLVNVFGVAFCVFRLYCPHIKVLYQLSSHNRPLARTKHITARAISIASCCGNCYEGQADYTEYKQNGRLLNRLNVTSPCAVSPRERYISQQRQRDCKERDTKTKQNLTSQFLPTHSLSKFFQCYDRILTNKCLIITNKRPRVKSFIIFVYQIIIEDLHNHIGLH